MARSSTRGLARSSSVRSATRICFFFSSRRRHTRLQGDWSSDVCSSDLPAGPAPTIRTSFITARGAPHLLLRRGPTPGALGSRQSLALARPSTSLGATLSLSKGRRSDVHPSKDNRTVLRSEAEAIAQRGLDLDRTAAVGNEIEIARRVGVALVDRRRKEPARHGQRRSDNACCPAGALRVANHRLHRRSG